MRGSRGFFEERSWWESSSDRQEWRECRFCRSKNLPSLQGRIHGVSSKNPRDPRLYLEIHVRVYASSFIHKNAKIGMFYLIRLYETAAT
jgi:hypothetical protein